MKPFRFKQFSVEQDKSVFRVGTDAVLLGALCSVDSAREILEVGCGTGIISLMLAQRNHQAQITAIDLNAKATGLSQRNFSQSPFADRLTVTEVNYTRYRPEKHFDLIVSNPPYFEQNSSTKDIHARQQTELSFSDLIVNCAELLTLDGLFSLIIPFAAAENFIEKCEMHGLFLCRRIDIRGIESAACKRSILEFGKEKKTVNCSEFSIESTPRQYSEAYLKLTAQFHVFDTKPAISENLR